MLAKPENIEPAPTTPPVKRRIVTLTNRSPVRIVEDQWPIIAQGHTGEGEDGCPFSWEIHFRVRREKRFSPPLPEEIGPVEIGHYLIHASFTCWEEDAEHDPDKCQVARVGRLLSWNEAQVNLWKHMQEVGEELRSRIHEERFRPYVTDAVDRAFASLTPDDHPWVSD